MRVKTFIFLNVERYIKKRIDRLYDRREKDYIYRVCAFMILI